MESSHEVVALVQDGRQNRGLRRRYMPWVAGLLAARVTPTGMARRRGIPLVWIDKMTDEELAPLRALNPDLLLVGGFGIILKKAILSVPALGCVNTHSSLLPKHRGPNPFHWIIRNRDPQSGVTFHIIDEGIDTGDILAQFPFDLTPTDTILSVYRKSCQLVEQQVVAVMDRIQAEGVHGVPQDHQAACYEKKPTPEELTIRWDQPAADIELLLRASVPMIRPQFNYRGRTVYVLKAKAHPVTTEAAPGSVIAARPKVRVAAAGGSVEILYAYSDGPIPMMWPMPWNRPKPGEKVS